ncbi:Ff.00g066760.m01.CDS01 [Fusarium sp. VM40]|nr:Ff.00g066760.m01.CDS01 [Fusarium sp. VM40]
MHKLQVGGFSLLESFHRGGFRRYKTFIITITAFILLYVTWMCSNLVVEAYESRLSYTSDFNTSDDQSGFWWARKATNTLIQSIPPKIWQIHLPKNGSDEKYVLDSKKLEMTASWLALNTDYTYTLVGKKGGDEFVQRHFANEPTIVEAYHKAPNVGMKSDLLRYLILEVEGGIYTDTDTIAIKPIDEWVPEELRGQVGLIVGIEFDRRNGGGWADIPHWLQFCQWTIAATPGHPVFKKMTRRAIRSMEDLSHKHNVSIEQLKPSSFEVMNSTGPAAWTDVVFEHLQGLDSTLNTTKDLSFMTEPKLYGDVLVLTIDGFGDFLAFLRSASSEPLTSFAHTVSGAVVNAIGIPIQWHSSDFGPTTTGARTSATGSATKTISSSTGTSSSDSTSSNGGLSSRSKAGIVIGAGVAALVFAALGWFVARERRAKQANNVAEIGGEDAKEPHIQQQQHPWELDSHDAMIPAELPSESVSHVRYK